MNEFIRYLGVGTINFLVCVASMFFFAKIGLHYIIYTAIGYALAIICSFFLNLKYTFTKTEYCKTKLLKFFGFSCFNLILVELIEVYLIQTQELRELYAVFIGMSWYTLSGFIINKFYIYQSYGLAQDL